MIRGFYSSPLLIIASIYALVQLRRTRRSDRPGGESRL